MNHQRSNKCFGKIPTSKRFSFKHSCHKSLLNNNSIYGYKLLGAGGGGFFLVIGKFKECQEYLTSVGLNPIPIEIDNNGCNILQTSSN